MKRILLVMVAALLCFSAGAQGLKGTWFVGGQLSFENSKTRSTGTEVKTSETMILPIVGAFVSPSVAVGAGLGYIGGKDKSAGIQVGKSNSFVFKPLVRKYWNITGGLFVYGQAALPMIFGSGETGADKAKYNTTDFALQISPGFDYVINSWLTVETSFTIFSVGFDKFKPKHGDSDTNFSFNANPFNSISDRKIGDLQIGLKFLF